MKTENDVVYDELVDEHTENTESALEQPEVAEIHGCGCGCLGVAPEEYEATLLPEDVSLEDGLLEDLLLEEELLLPEMLPLEEFPSPEALPLEEPLLEEFSSPEEIETANFESFAQIAPMSSDFIVVGSQVRVNQNATTWATGEGIPTWVRGQVYQVIEMRNNGNELLLGGILSWIRHANVTLVSGGGTSAPPVGGGNFVVGNSVILAPNAVWYGTNTVVPQFARDRISQIIEIIGNRVVIAYGGAVVGAVRRQDLRNTSGGSTPPPTTGGGNFTVGSSVTLAASAVWYGTNTAVPQFARTRVSRVIEIIGNRVVITYGGVVVGAVRFQDLRNTSGGGGNPPAGGGSFAVGHSVTLAASAVWYGTSTAVPQFARTRVSQIIEIIGSRVVITYGGAVVGAVRLQDLRMAGGGGGTTPPSGGGTSGSSSVINRMHIALGRGADDRNLNNITQIVIHHSANPVNGNHVNTAMFENHWRGNTGMGFPGDNRGGYHEVVLYNGSVEVNMQDRRRMWGAASQNNHTWHIAVTGQHASGINNVTTTQLRTLAIRIAAAMRRFGWSASHVTRIVRHRDLPGQSTLCNDINITNIRNEVRALLSASTPHPPSNTTMNLTQAQMNVVNSRIHSQISAIHRSIGIGGAVPDRFFSNLVFTRRTQTLPFVPPTCITPRVDRRLVVQGAVPGNTPLEFDNIIIQNGRITRETPSLGEGVLGILRGLNTRFENMQLPQFQAQLPQIIGQPNVTVRLAFDGRDPGIEIVVRDRFTLSGTQNVMDVEYILTLIPRGVRLTCNSPVAIPAAAHASVTSTTSDALDFIRQHAGTGLRILIISGIVIGAIALAKPLALSTAAGAVGNADVISAARRVLVEAINNVLGLWGLPIFQ
ncbi:MAG: N-acetylmuramoyl-L-alanine amidase [Turicibacter sp.]|nr:N-acetylmuramoyl-L-alanine amidase [Turicibacter sp.]